MDTLKSIDADIKHHLPLLNPRQKKTVLMVIKNFAADQKDWWAEISEEQQNAIDASLSQMKEGKLIPHNEVMKKYKKWIK